MELASGELADAVTACEVSTVCSENSVEGKSVGLGKEEEMWHMHEDTCMETTDCLNIGC